MNINRHRNNTSKIENIKGVSEWHGHSSANENIANTRYLEENIQPIQEKKHENMMPMQENKHEKMMPMQENKHEKMMPMQELPTMPNMPILPITENKSHMQPEMPAQIMPMMEKKRQVENMPYMKISKDELLRRLTAFDFMAVDLQLYLDTHPTDRAALEKYNAIILQADALRNLYQSQYGSLYSFRSASNYPWEWINPPWPWNYEANFLLDGEE